MQIYANNVQDRSGNAIAGANVLVLKEDGSTASIFSDNGVTALPNPFQTDEDGEFRFYAVSGKYSVTVSGSMLPADIEFPGIILFDPDDINGSIRDELSSTGAGKGAEMVAFDGGTVQDVLDDAKPMQSYTALRAYTGRATGVRITTPGIAGFFARDAGDTTSTDNGGTVIVDASGRRWKRLYSGAVHVLWFGADPAGIADSTAAIQAAMDAEDIVVFDAGSYKITSTLNLNRWGQSLIGESVCAYGGNLSKSTLLHAFNGDLLRINPVYSGDRGRHRIKGVQFKSDNVFTGRAIVITGGQDTIEECAFYRFRSGAIRISGVSYGTYIQKNAFDQCGAAGVYDVSGDADTGASASNYNTITLIADNIFESSQYGAISLRNSDPFYILRNYIDPFNSTTTQPMIQILNSSSGNTKGDVEANYIGSLNGLNGFAIDAAGSFVNVKGNICTDFPNGIKLSTLIGSVSGNEVRGFTGLGIQILSATSNVNNNVTAFGNVLETKSTGAVHGILLSNSVSGVNVSGNIVSGKCDYYIRLLSCSKSLVVGNQIAPLAGASASGTGIFEDDTNTSGNTVKGNSVVATTAYRRSSFDYDVFFAGAAPTTGTWKRGDVVWHSSPSAAAAPGWVCVTAGTPGTWKAMANLAA